jgi:hypothetical protein
VTAGLLAAALVSAEAARGGATMSVHAAKGGELGGSRLILRGVGRRVTWVTHAGRSGVVSINRLHRRLFQPGTPATAALHVAGRPGGAEPTFRLTRPRYNAARRTASYRVKRLNKRRPSRAASGAAGFRRPRRFGAASLSIVGAPQIMSGDNGGNDCSVTVTNSTPWPLQATGEAKWPTDTWDPGIPFADVLPQGQSISWGSDGGLFRGCSVTGQWTVIPDPDAPPNPPQGSFVLNTTWTWNSGAGTGHTCSPTNTGSYYCQDWTTAGVGSGVWELKYIFPPPGR